jgi:dTDP-4-amino-4,6-dideoxygalactose transaminase
MKKKYIAFAKPRLGEEEINEVVSTIKSGWLTTGQKTQKFQKEFAKYTGAQYALALNSATAALHLGLKACGINEGDEVITTANSFVATSLAILHNRAIPVFVDIDKNTYNINAKLIEEKITKKTKAILPVHYAGYPCDMDMILEIAKKYNLKVVEDAAHATESFLNNKKIGTFSDATAFSFYATKNLICGEGGMLTTNSKEIAENVEINTLHGIDKDAWKRYMKNSNKRIYDVIDEGYKYNMSDIQASIGIWQLKKINKNHNIRKKYWKIYNDILSDTVAKLPPEIPDNIVHSMHIYNILIDFNKLSIERDEFMDVMEKHGVGTAVHFPAIHKFTYFKKLFKDISLPVTENFCNNTVSLPFTPYLTSEEVFIIAHTVKKVLKKYTK